MNRSSQPNNNTSWLDLKLSLAHGSLAAQDGVDQRLHLRKIDDCPPAEKDSGIVSKIELTCRI
jgi:hypothetical protein